jgi:hypothetical protein
MLKSLSMTFSIAFDLFAPMLVGALFFFTIIGVFGIWFAIGGLLLAIVLALAIFIRIPVGGDTR